MNNLITYYKININFLNRIIFCVIFSFFSACASKENNNPNYVYFDPNLPSSVHLISLEDIQVRGSAWNVNEDGTEQDVIVNETDIFPTTKGYYALPTDKKLPDQQNYLFHLSVYVKAGSTSISALSESYYSENGMIEVQAGASSCPSLNISADHSLVTFEDEQWLLLCEVKTNQVFVRDELITISENEITCLGDADGDGLSNLNEISTNLNPYNPDLDGDCVVDEEDAFPTDPLEWVDTDGDGAGDNSDQDADGDGLTDVEEENLGTNSLDSDSDDDGVTDSLDNCPLNGSSADQTDTDADGTGDICESDTDGDGLSDAEEASLGTNSLDSDTDDDNVSDFLEVQNHTNPLDTDSDDDGVNDGDDAFPLDLAESLDSDADGIGDNSDLCLNISNENDVDLDADSLGNDCDTDDDGDGVADEVEIKIGANPESADSDGDGLTDWFGGVKSSGSDGCLLDPTFDDMDADGDGFNSICDCEDNSSSINPATNDPADDGLDSDCDGVDGNKNNAIFVDLENGNDGNDGSFGNPVQNLLIGISLGLESGKDVYVSEGVVTLTSTLNLENNIAIYGGYSHDFLTHEPLAFPTQITANNLETGIEISGGAVVSIFGLHIYSSEKETNTTMVSVDGSSLTFIYSWLIGSGGRHTIGLYAYQSEINFSYTEINLSNLTSENVNTGYGFYLEQTTGSISNTQITITDFTSDRTGIYCSEEGSEAITLSDDSIDLLESGETLVDGFFVYIFDCSGENIYTTIDTVIPELSGFDITNLIVD